MNDLTAILFSGPLQTPLATPDAEQQGQRIETTVQRLATTASPATLASWSSTLDGMTQALNAAEKAATGVDPAAPPQGWTEPANFQAARGVLTSLKATVVQAQAAQGVVPALAQPAQPATPAQAALQANTPKFMLPEPTGQASARLFGAPAAGEGGKAAPSAPLAAPPAAPAAAPATGTGATVRAASAPAAPASSQAAAQATGAPAVKTGTPPLPSPRDVSLSVKPEAATGTPGGRAAASTSTPVSTAPTPQQGPAGKSLAATATEAATLQPAASTAAQAGPAGPAGPADQGGALAAAQAAAASTAAAGPAAQAAATDPTRAAPAAVAYLAAAIVKQANGKSTSFNIELHPADLGRVDVKLQIQADGQLAARMSFDNPAAAASFQAHADDLRRSLEQAGFQLSNNSLSFTGRDAETANGGSDGFSGQGGSGQSSGGSRAFAGARAPPSTAEAAAGAPQNLQAVGLDMRI